MTDHVKFEMAMIRVRHRLRKDGKPLPSTFRELLDLAEQEYQAGEARLAEQRTHIGSDGKMHGDLSNLHKF